MPLARTTDLVTRAHAAGSAVGAFNIITLEHAEAVIEAADHAHTSVILQISENGVRYHRGKLLPLAAAAAALAEQAAASVSLHLDHVTDPDLLRAVAGTAVSSVMFDAGARPYRQNVAETRAAAQWAHEHGLWIEAELGYVGGKPDQPISAHAEGARTDPAEAEQFVRETGIDALAVAVGSSHAMTERTARLDSELARHIAQRTPIPLVLHGSSGVPDDDLRAAVRAGIAKVNVGTALNVALTNAVRAALDQDADLVDPRRYLSAGRTAMKAATTRVLEVLAT